MRLKRLELQGFKSFVDRTILTFEASITGVVGPNGCGKSNIVDAILWVMGEQSPKHLRGESMTDVIFAGSESRAPTSMAEVSLILDRRGVALAPQFAAFDKGEEISVTRRIYRDGTGEFLINKQGCRLKDIHELFMDTGVGRRAYSIIEQGQIDRMINVKPEERRLIFEEVAGITKYKAKRKEAERKLEQTQANILRLNDIVAELEKQIRSLKVQASRAKKFRSLKEELEAGDLFLMGRNLFEHKQQLEELGGRRDTLNLTRSKLDAGCAERDAAVSELEIRRVDEERELQNLGARERDLMLRIARIESQLLLFEERKRAIQESAEAAAAEAAEISGQLEELTAEQDLKHAERTRLDEALVQMAAEIEAAEGLGRGLHERRVRIVSQRDATQRRRADLARRGVSLEKQIEHSSQREHELLEVQTRLNEELTELVVLLSGLKEKLAEADSRTSACDARGREAEAQVAEISAECQSASARLSELEDSLFQARERFHLKSSRLASLRELQENLEGYSPTAREVLLKLQGSDVKALPLAESIAPEADVEEHLEALLGAQMNTLVVNTAAEAERLARLIREADLERVGIVALDDVAEVASAPIPFEERPILSKVRVAPGYERLINRLLGSVYLCADADALFRLRAAHAGVSWVTDDGKIVAWSDGTLLSGRLPTRTGVFARRREIGALEGECRELEGQVIGLETQRASLFDYLQAQELRHEDLRSRLSSIHIERVECRKEKEKIQIEHGRADRDYTESLRESERNRGQIDELASHLAIWRDESAAVVVEREELEREAVTVEEESAAVAEELERIGVQVGELRVSRSAQAERLNGLESLILKLESDSSSLKRRGESLEATSARNARELGEIAAGYGGVVDEKAEAGVALAATQVGISDARSAFEETCTRLTTLRDERAALDKERQVCVDETQELEVRLAGAQAEFEHLKGLSLERYQQEATPLDAGAVLDLLKMPLLADQLGEQWDSLAEPDRRIVLGEHLKSMREKLSRYGEVNLTAIQEYEEVQGRYDFLMEQKTDLDNSIRILGEAIVKIDESTKARFVETFEAVNVKFAEIFPILFNGGKADLTLTNPDNLLEAGVDIMVQPPGKRLQSISLLSGGEKALTAVSLVLAIFARKPSPFCLLDEVDAPLDDANVSRFNTVIRKMAEKTQFIVITHNKKTMEIAEALYGVTMERAGVSKMTSVRLQ